MTQATEQQKLFVDEYLKLRKTNATQACINAGYSEKSASSQASQLLKNPRVMEYLDERERQLQDELKQAFFFDALEARKVLFNIMKNPEARDRDRIICAKDLLDRAGYKPTENVQVTEHRPIGETADLIEKYFAEME